MLEAVVAVLILLAVSVALQARVMGALADKALPFNTLALQPLLIVVAEAEARLAILTP
jgi:hypothetical protein